MSPDITVKEPQTDTGQLRRASVHGVVTSVGSEAAKFCMRFSYQIVMARLLLPTDFGVVAMAAPAIAFVQLFADLGLTDATIQRSEISEAQLSFLFWVNVAAGVALAAVTCALAPAVAAFYHEPRVTNVMLATAGLLLLGGLFSQHQALLTRGMRFRALAALDLGSFAIGAAGGIASAWLGAGYCAILINQGLTSLSAIVIAWWVSRWIPGRPGRVAEMKPLLHFGSNITLFRFVSFFSRNSDNILLGRYAGEYALGLYDRACKLTLLPFMQVSLPFTKVAVPLLSRSNHDPVFYRKAYSRMLEALLLLVYPGLIFMLANSRSLITLALGARWVGVAPIFVLLGIDAFVAPVGNSMGWLFLSQGRSRELRDWSVPASLLFVVAFVIGLHWGPQGVAAGYAAAGMTEMTYLWRVATRTGPLSGRDFWATLAPFLFAVAVTFGTVLGAASILPSGIGGLALSLSLAYSTFLAALLLLPRGRSLLRQLFSMVLGRLRPSRSLTANLVEG